MKKQNGTDFAERTVMALATATADAIEANERVVVLTAALVKHYSVALPEPARDSHRAALS
jgi:hypothetical protein